ncbi:hypothetical protein D3C78_750170 [compost metagenome]
MTASDKAGTNFGEVRTQTTNRLGLVRVHIKVQGVQPVHDEHCTQGSDKWRNVKLGNDNTIYKSTEKTSNDSNCYRKDYFHLRKIWKKPTGIVWDLQHRSGDNRRKTNHPSSGQVSTCRNKDKGNPKCDDNACRRLNQYVTQGVDGHKVWIIYDDPHNQQYQHNVNCVLSHKGLSFFNVH